MKKFIKSFFCVALLSSAVAIEADSNCNDCNIDCTSSCDDDRCISDCLPTGTLGCIGTCGSTPIYRSVNDNLMRRDQLYINAGDSLYDNDCFKAILGLDFEYMRSFNGKKLARGLFGTGGLVFSGSDASVRQADTLIADNFGLSQFLPATTLCFSPRVSNVILDFRAHFALDNWLEGLYLTLNAPFAHSEWQLNPGSNCATKCKDSCDTGCKDSCNISCKDSCDTSCKNVSSCCPTPTGVLNGTPFLCGYMDTATPCTTNILPATSFQQALGGDYLFGDMQTPWQFGRFSFCKQQKNAVAALDILLGYNFKRCEDHHVGIYMRTVAPTGNNPNPRNVFAPVVGYGKHWELGAGLTAHWKLWNCDEDQDLVAFLDGNVTHLFTNSQTRSFDFQGKGCLSRYMLLKAFDGAGNYTGTLINGINFATRNARVTISVKGEAMLELVYRNGGFRVGVGGDVWGMTAEKVCIKQSAACSTLDRSLNYGFKGCEGVSGRVYNISGDPALITTEADPVALNSTASAATITSCANRLVDNGVFVAASNTAGSTVALDYSSAAPVLGVTTAASVFDGGFVAPFVGALQSNPPVYVTVNDLDPQSAASPSQVSGSVFGTASYAWTDCDWTPALGIGASGEFSGRNGTLNQWGIWINGSVTF